MDRFLFCVCLIQFWGHAVIGAEPDCTVFDRSIRKTKKKPSRPLKKTFHSIFHPGPPLYVSEPYEIRLAKLQKRLQSRGVLQNPLSDEELVAIDTYGSEGAWTLNEALRSGDGAQIEYLRPFIRALDSALAKLTPVQKLVYRTANLPDDVAAEYVEGHIFKSPAFLSTSEKLTGDSNFEIVSKSGRSIKQYVFRQNEEEVLFPRGTRFRIVERLERREEQSGNKFYFYRVEELD